jgi:hypothetical protein
MRKISPASRPLTRANRRPMPSVHTRTAPSLFRARQRGAYQRVAQYLLCTSVKVSWTCVHGRRVCEFYRNITWAQKSPHLAGRRPGQMRGQCLLARQHHLGAEIPPLSRPQIRANTRPMPTRTACSAQYQNHTHQNAVLLGRPRRAAKKAPTLRGRSSAAMRDRRANLSPLESAFKIL